jgi:hypothetical protein
MLRQSLDAGSPYLDVSTHGDGMTALQFRDAPAGESFEIRVSQAGPKRLRIEKHGDEATVFIADKVGDSFRFTGAGHTLKLAGDFYVGLGVCSHNDANLETVVFSNVEVKPGPFTATSKLYYTIETQSAASAPGTDRYALYTSTDSLDSPVWLADTSAIVFISKGRLMRIPVSPTPAKNANGETLASSPRPATGVPVAIVTGGVTDIKGNIGPSLDGKIHGPIGLSPDGKTLVITNGGPPSPSGFNTNTSSSGIYTVPVAGGKPKTILDSGATAGSGESPSFSPDGKTIVFSRMLNSLPLSAPPYEFLILSELFAVTLDAGEFNSALLRFGSYNDKRSNNYHPAYSADGSTIYFTSDRSGTAQVWQMKADGSEPVQVTNDDNNNYFSSVSPTAPGVILFITYPKDVKGQPDNSPIMVRRLNANKAIDVIARITGGARTAPSWSQDGRYRAFVSQHRVYAD